MEVNETTNTYELAYHISPDVGDEQLAKETQGVIDAVTQNGGSVIHTTDPKRTRLSYPIKKKRYSYFGTIDFTAGPDSVLPLNRQLALDQSVLRHLVIVKDTAHTTTLSEKHMRSETRQDTKPRTSDTTAAPKNAPVPPTPEQQKEMTKEIEDVLEKI